MWRGSPTGAVPKQPASPRSRSSPPCVIPNSPRASSSADMPAQLWMRFEESDGATLLRLKQHPPWRVIRGFPTAGGETLAHLHNVSGGILDNDDLLLQIEVGPAARAQITTTGATRVYRSRSPGAVSRQRTEISIAARGLLEYLPDPLIPYARSRFEQSATIELHDGATLFWRETTTPGTETAGEGFE